jgi:hypothetical protein
VTFKELQDAVILNTFDETDRAQVKNWINHRYTVLCDAEDWSFMRATAGVTVTAGSQTVTNLPSDYGVGNALLDQYGERLELIGDPSEFVRRYMDTTVSYTGQPEAFTAFGSPSTFDGGLFGDGDFGGGEGLLAVGPTSNVTSNQFRLLYQRATPLLVADADVPTLPSGHHMTLVYGARAEGLGLSGLPEADSAERLFLAGLDAMRRKYLRPLRARMSQAPAYRPC